MQSTKPSDQVAFLDLKFCWNELQDELETAMLTSVRSGMYIGGSDVETFENEFAAYAGTEHCIGVGNGLDAITVSLMTLQIGPGDEVIVPAHTFIASWLPIVRLGATVVPVAPDMTTMNMNPDLLEQAITKNTRVVMPVHLYGRPAKLDQIAAICEHHKIPIIEDAAQAHGATLNGKRIGSWGNTTCWSFYPGKNLGAAGDAGAITTNDPLIAKQARNIANYGSSRKYIHESIGINSRLDPVQAATLSVKLRHLEKWNTRRSQLAEHYINRLNTSDLILPPGNDTACSSWHLFVVRIEQRNELAQFLADRGIQTLIHYPTACSDHQAFSGLNIPASQAARDIANTALSLPIGPHLQLEDADKVADAIKQFFGNNSKADRPPIASDS